MTQQRSATPAAGVSRYGSAGARGGPIGSTIQPAAKGAASRERPGVPLDLPFLPAGAVADGDRPHHAASPPAFPPPTIHQTTTPPTTLSARASLPSWGWRPCSFIGKINYQRFRGVAKLALYGSIVLLVLVIIPGNPLAVTRNNATRWLGVGDLFTFQPSELAKAGRWSSISPTSISKKKDKMQTFR